MGRYRHQEPCQCAVGGLPLGCRVIGLYYPALPRVFTLPSLSSIQVAHGEPMPVWSSVNLCDCIPLSRLGVGFHPSRLPSTWVTVFLGWLPTALISPFQSVLSETDPSRIPQHQFRTQEQGWRPSSSICLKLFSPTEASLTPCQYN